MSCRRRHLRQWRGRNAHRRIVARVRGVRWQRPAVEGDHRRFTRSMVPIIFAEELLQGVTSGAALELAGARTLRPPPPCLLAPTAMSLMGDDAPLFPGAAEEDDGDPY